MLKQFNSNARKINRIISQINLNNLSGSGYLDNLLDDYKLQSSLSASFDGRDTNGNPLSITEAYQELSASFTYSYTSSVDTHIPTKSQSKTRSNLTPIKLVNNKSKISDFYEEILQNSARLISRQIDVFDNTANTLTIYNVHTDYGTEGASAENFEILVFGLHIPGDYTIKDIGNNVVITLGGEYIDFENTDVSDIYVIGKLVDVPISSEDNSVLTTEDGLDIII